MAQYLPSTLHPNFPAMRQAHGTKISLGLCSYFFCVHNRSPLAQKIPTDQELSRPTHLRYFFLVERLVSASAGAKPPLYGIVCGLLGWNSRVCGGYEVDFILLCSPHPRCVVALFLLLFGAIWERERKNVTRSLLRKAKQFLNL